MNYLIVKNAIRSFQQDKRKKGTGYRGKVSYFRPHPLWEVETFEKRSERHMTGQALWMCGKSKDRR